MKDLNKELQFQLEEQHQKIKATMSDNVTLKESEQAVDFYKAELTKSKALLHTA